MNFKILFHINEATSLTRIVGFEVVPYSIEHTYSGSIPNNNDLSKIQLQTCVPGENSGNPISTAPLILEENKEIIYTYTVEFTVNLIF